MTFAKIFSILRQTTALINCGVFSVSTIYHEICLFFEVYKGCYTKVAIGLAVVPSRNQFFGEKNRARATSQTSELQAAAGEPQISRSDDHGGMGDTHHPVLPQLTYGHRKKS